MLIPQYKGFQQERQIGELTIYLPDPPDISKIAYHKQPQEKQYFRPIRMPDGIYGKDREKWLIDEWGRRNNGFWFFNNGNLEYITGAHYFYINWWVIPVKKLLADGRKAKIPGLPSFVDSDRDYWYVWRHCVVDELCAGLVHITGRRDGKSYRGLCTIYEEVSKRPQAMGGIQSKSGNDAKSLFKKLVRSWKKLPQFYKPIDVGDRNPVTALVFDEPPKRDTKMQRKTHQDVLESEINWKNSKEEAYDGEGLWAYLMDEYGKNTEANVYDTWQIVKETMVDGTDILGKSLLTTTVEEMERRGGANAKKIWDESNPNDRTPIGMTESGLYRYFKPAYYGLRGDDKQIEKDFIDRYGYSDQEAAKAFLEKRRSGLRGEALLSEMRKYPFTIEEAFRSTGGNNTYDIVKIQEQMDFNEELPASHLSRGNFVWKDGERDSEVVWHPNQQGRWLVRRLPPAELRNFRINKGGKPAPGNEKEIVAGVDPYDHKSTDTLGKKSNAASHVFWKFDPMHPAETGMFVSEYIYRHPKPELFYEDMIMQAVFYGHHTLIETNKTGVINHFDLRGYGHYLMDRPPETHSEWSEAKTTKTAKGIPMTGPVPREALMNVTESYIYENVGINETTGFMGKMYFNRTLQQWMDFDPMKWTPFDAAVSSGLTLLAARRYIAKKKERKAYAFVKTYSQRGTRSKRVR